MTGQMQRHLQRREKKSGEKGREWWEQWVTWFIEARTRTYSQEERAGEMWPRDEGVSTWVKAENTAKDFHEHYPRGVNPNHRTWDRTGDGGVRSANRATALWAKFSMDRRKLENKFEAENQTSPHYQSGHREGKPPPIQTWLCCSAVLAHLTLLLS